jgi:predicted MFS family arabinose efflux permease
MLNLRKGREMTKARTIGVMIAALTTLLVGILDLTIVSTSAIHIARSLAPVGGVADVPWLLAGYALASAAVQPLYGKLADAFGAKAVYLATVALFVLGSVLCGLAQTMPELIVFRALQGLGGGGLMSVTMVVIGHLSADRADRAPGGNAIAAVLLGLGLVGGPLLGGLVTDAVGWRWIFFINVPVGVTAFAVMALCLRLPRPARPESLELPSAGLLAVAAAGLLAVCQWGGHQFFWTSAQILGCAGLCLAAVVGFCWRQRRAREPFFPTRLLRHPTLRAVTLLQLTTGLGMAAGTIYLTLDLQLVRGSTAVQTGLQLLPVAAGLGLGSLLGQRIARSGRPMKASIVGGSGVSALALGGFALCSPGAPIAVLYAIMVVFGTGIGLGLGNEMLLVYASVERRDLGVATTGIRFVETLGTSLGATAFATLFTALVPDGATPARTFAALGLIFGIGAAIMGGATVVALTLPLSASRLPAGRPPAGALPAGLPALVAGDDPLHVAGVVAVAEPAGQVLLVQPAEGVPVELDPEPGPAGDRDRAAAEAERLAGHDVLGLPGPVRVARVGEVGHGGGELHHRRQADAQVRVGVHRQAEAPGLADPGQQL